MGRFTIQDNKLVDEKIQEDMELICKCVLKYINPVSILLIGSFGRGEGSVLIEDNKIFPLKDYDILIVSNSNLLSSVKLQQVNDELYTALNYSLPKDRIYLFSDFVITIEQTVVENLRTFAHIAVYDIKMGSQLLFGRDIRNEIPLSIEDIPSSSELHVLFMKTIGLLGQFSSTYLINPPDTHKKIYIMYECGKTYIEIGTALCLFSKKYCPRYLKRSESFVKIFNENLFDLEQKIPNLPDKIMYYTKLKLIPDINEYNHMNYITLWFETRNDLRTIINYLFEKKYGMSDIDLIKSSKIYYHEMKKNYYKETIIFFLKHKFGISNSLVSVSLNFLYQKYFSLMYVIDLYQKSKMLYPKALLESPLQKVFSLSILLLFSLNEDGSLNSDLFSMFEEELKKIYPFNIDCSDNLEKWDLAKNCLLDAFDLYKGQR